MTPDLTLPFSDDYLLTHIAYRPLKRLDPMMRGADVYALQTGLQAFSFGGEGAEPYPKADGILGDQTKGAIGTFQKDHPVLLIDGKADYVAGGATQREIARLICRKYGATFSLPAGLPFGHADHESSCILGNYTRPYKDGHRDRGVVQINGNDATAAAAFDVGSAIAVCAQRIRDYHVRYRGMGVADALAWRLACGSWNAPAYTDALAQGKTSVTLSDGVVIDLKPGAPERVHIETYMDQTTFYANL